MATNNPAFPNNPSYPTPAAMYPTLAAQVQQQQQPQPGPFDPVLTLNPNLQNYYPPTQTQLYYANPTATTQPTQSNYYYPVQPQVPFNLYSTNLPAHQPTQTNYYTHTYTAQQPQLYPAPIPPQQSQLPVYTLTSTVATQPLPAYPSSSLSTLYPVMDPSPKIGSSSNLSLIPSNLSFDQTVQKSEALILDHLQQFPLNSSSPQQTYQAHLREKVAKEIVKKFAAPYREKFNATGTIDLNQIKNDSFTLRNLLTANEKFNTHLNLNMLYLNEIFELGNENPTFEVVQKKILQEADKAKQNSAKKPPFSLLKLFKSPKKPEENTATSMSKILETLNLIQNEWNTLSYVPTDTIPTAPGCDENYPALLGPIYPQTPASSIATLPPASIATLPPFLPSYGAPIENNPQPAPEPVKPAQPITDKKYSVNDDIPVKSYIELAFPNVRFLDLPDLIKGDVLRHAKYSPGVRGKAEEEAVAIYKDLGSISQKLKSIRSIPLSNDEFSIAGQKLLDLYYSDKIGVLGEFMKGFEALPKTGRFYQYVYEMAKAANVHIADWDKQFAENNWNKPGIFHLSIQALERCLHTSANG